MLIVDFPCIEQPFTRMSVQKYFFLYVLAYVHHNVPGHDSISTPKKINSIRFSFPQHRVKCVTIWYSFLLYSRFFFRRWISICIFSFNSFKYFHYSFYPFLLPSSLHFSQVTAFRLLQIIFSVLKSSLFEDRE